MSKPSPIESVRCWFTGHGLPWNDDIESTLTEFGVERVEDLKFIRKNEWSDLFTSQSPILRRLATLVYEQHLAGDSDPMFREMVTLAATSTAAGVAKRRKLLATASAAAIVDDSEIKIIGLPEWAIREIIDYIPKTSRALLALALTSDSASWRDIHWNKSAPKSILSWFKKGPTSSKKMKRPSAITKLILSPKNEDEEDLWEEINFGDNEWDLCIELRDDDIAGMLACINSVQKLKRLYLTYCENISGRGLEPLRGSTVLERLDISLARKHYDGRYGECHLLETDVIPILDSILDRENHSLKHLQFPYRWRTETFWNREVQTGYFARFMQKYNETEYQQSIRCQKCNANCREHLSICREDETKYFGTQGNTCYDCLSHYCYNCCDEEGQFYLTFCVSCEKFRCKYCMTMKPCRSCRQSAFTQELQPGYTERNDISFMCIDCEGSRYCRECGHDFCDNCSQEVRWCNDCDRTGCRTCMNMLRCEHVDCRARTCGSCRDNNIGGLERAVKTCRRCRRNLCFTHRLNACKLNWDASCRECVVMIAPKLARGYERRRLRE
ncbi:hypothetical protein QTG54_014739 [Skeletonema marinoi]|uniref:Uncharacterized protein n=1 Tax=Skeletonema marinoi TaxID=267567 RepID=A0AAD8XW94_9STRA|nr:hypothetical protein QTG54_014739 [Skeletonema marinoi]